MTIATLSDLVGGMAAAQRAFVQKSAQSAAEGVGVAQSFLDRAGNPGAATLPLTLAGANFTSASAGAVPFADPSPGSAYLGSLTGVLTVAGELLVHDLLWANGGISPTTTTAQAITTPTFPARDANGSTNGAGLELWLADFSATASNASPITNTAASYTNSAGTAGRTATIASVPATLTAGSLMKFQLQGDDVGVRSVQSLTLGTSWGLGTPCLMVMRRLADVPVPAAGTVFAYGWDQLGLPLVYPGTFLHLAAVPAAASAVAVTSLQLLFPQK